MADKILRAPAATSPCTMHGYHQPAPVWTHRHHVIPKSWTDQLGLPESRLVDLCPHGHDALHVALRLELKGASWTGGPVLRNLIREARAFYDQYPNAQPVLRGLAQQL